MFKIVISALIFSFVASAHAAYDKSWYQTDFWSGEWPPGFSVPKRNVHIWGRLNMDPVAKRNVDCQMPYKAVFNPWNSKRNKKSNAAYWMASKIVILTAKEDYTLKDDEKTVEIKKGQTFEYLHYYAEGMFAVRINGQVYSADQDLYEHVEAIPDGSSVEENWLRLRCVNGRSAWIYTKDLLTTDKDGNTKYRHGLWNASIGNPGVDGYGKARDLTDAEIRSGGH